MRNVRCAVKPYVGNDPYIFFSFCQRDESVAGPIVESMVKSGYRVWFDDDTIPNDKWLRTLADRLSNSRVCMALISKTSVDDHICRNIINLALECGVLLIPLLLDTVSLTPATALLLKQKPPVKLSVSALSSTSGMEAFLQIAVKHSECNLCRQASFNGRQLSCVAVSDLPKSNPSIPVEPVLDDYTVIEGPPQKVEEDKPEEIAPVQDEPQIPESDGEDERTVRIEPVRDDPPTIALSPKKTSDRVLIDLKLGKVFRLGEGVARLGRSRSNDYRFEDDSISAKHAQIFMNESGETMVKDVDSTNGTFLNGIKINADTPQTVGNFSIITLPNCCHLLYLTGKSAKDMLQQGYAAYLVCAENNEVMGLHPGFILGRENPWPSGAFSEDTISREHGVFQAEKDGYQFLAGRSTNGTTFNGKELREGQYTGILKADDEIRIAKTHLVRYYVVKLREE